MTWYRSKAFRRLHLSSKWLLFSVIFLAAFLTVGGRLILSEIDRFKPVIIDSLEKMDIHGVTVDKLRGEWNGLVPVISVKGAALSIPGRSKALSINEIEFQLDLFESLKNTSLTISTVMASIEKLILVHDAGQGWRINDIPLIQDNNTRFSADSLFQWVNSLPFYLGININLIQIKDEVTGLDHRIQNSSLISSRASNRLQLEFRSQLPTNLGQSVHLRSTGDGKNQRFYLDADNINIAELIKLTGQTDSSLRRGRVDLQAWVEIEQLQLQQLVMVSDVKAVRIAAARTLNPELSFSVIQQFDREQPGWRINSHVSKVKKGQQTMPDVKAQLLHDPEQDMPLIWVDELSVASLSQLFGDWMEAEIHSVIESVQPQARLHNLVGRINLEHPGSSLMGFEFNQVQTLPAGDIPGFSGFSGSLIADNAQANVKLYGQQAQLSFEALFRDPLAFDHFSTEVLLDFRKDVTIISSDAFVLNNQDLDMQGRLWLEVPADGPAFLSLRSDYQNGRAESTGKYLPVSIMQPELVKWLDDSINQGRLSQGDLIFHGRLQPFSSFQRNMSGEFEALFDVEKLQLGFLADWPTVKNASVTASFHNMDMSIKVHQADFAASSVSMAEVSIDDYRNSLLKVKAETSNSASQTLETLAQLPVADVSEEIQRRATKLSGHTSSLVDLVIPLDDQHQDALKVSVDSSLEQVGISIDEWMVDLTEVNGRFIVDNERLSSIGLQGLYAGDKVDLSVSTDSKRQRTVFKINGPVSSRSLLTFLPEKISNKVNGHSDWLINVSVDNLNRPQQPLLEIDARSGLSGTEIDLPQPFTLQRPQTASLLFKGRLSHQFMFLFDLDIDQRLSSRWQFDLSDKAGNELIMLDASLGDKANQLKRPNDMKPGVAVRGHLSSLNVNDWFHMTDGLASDDQERLLMKKIQQVDLDIDQVDVGGHLFDNVRLTLSNQAESLFGDIESDQIKGKYRLPYVMDQQTPLSADLEYLRLSKPEASEDKQQIKWAIKDMPTLVVKSREIELQGKTFDLMTLKTHITDDRFVIDQLDFSRDAIQWKSSGFWHHDQKNDEHVSVFNISIKGEKFGQTIDALGFGETLRDGEIDFSGQIGWGGELYNLSWPTLLGEVQMNLNKGYLRNVNPGAGRFVGLLSLNALPRRLFLDFGDVVREGTQFNEIKGSFKIKGEVMQTENAEMDAVSAKVKIIGSTNLREKTYDQSMIIIPRVSDTLPVIGGLAAGSGVGWGLLLLNKLFQNPIEKSVEIEYKVTGGWSDPNVELVKKTVPETNAGNEPDSVFNQ